MFALAATQYLSSSLVKRDKDLRWPDFAEVGEAAGGRELFFFGVRRHESRPC